MGHAESKGRGAARAVPGVLALSLCLAFLLAPPSQAAYEQTGCFAGHFPGPIESCKPLSEAELKAEGFKFSEEVQLGGVVGMAVNHTGAGGVEPGTVYAVTKEGASGASTRVAMFTPEGEGLKFSLGWHVTTAEEPYERCGPDLEPTPTKCPIRVKSGPGAIDIEVDQSTGNVYVYSGEGNPAAGRKYIAVYEPDGSAVITRFGERVPGTQSTATSPELMHGTGSTSSNGLAVDDSGTVYFYDASFDFYQRLMVFEPQSPGDYEHYVYAGEVLTDTGPVTKYPTLDDAGNIYAVAGDKVIRMYPPQTPAPYPAPAATPTCSFEFAAGGITTIAVDPVSGTPFFFTYKNPKRLYQLGPCNPETGQFTGGIVGETVVKPERDDLYGLAFDPVRKLTGRPAGVLYGGAPNPVSSVGAGKGEPGQSSLGYVFAQPELQPSPPEVISQSISGVTATTAQLQAQANPGGFETTYRFQYETQAAYEANPPEERFAGAAEAPVGGAVLGTAKEALAAAAQLNNLQPDTPYRYRVLLESECSPAEPGQICAVPGSAEDFTTFPSTLPGLPDDRAYELVSPPQKNGGQVFPADPRISSCGPETACKPGEQPATHFPMLSAPDGEAVAYEGSAFDPEEGATVENSYIARRDPEAGWQTVNPTPKPMESRGGGGGGGYQAFSEELDEGVLRQLSPLALSPLAPAGYPNLYAQSTTSPFALAPLLTAAPPNSGNEFKARYAGASKDLSRVFFAANDALTDETAFAPAAVDGGPTKFNLYEWERATGQLRLVNVAPGNATTEPGASFGVASANTVSADGSRAFFSDEAGQVYVREGAEATVAIPDPGKFLSASTDGSKVLLGNGHIYDLESEATTDLTEGQGGFGGIAGQSEDLSHVYFIDTEVLSGEEANGEGAKAQAGKPNLYAWEEGTTTYVATLLAKDNSGSNVIQSSTWSPFPFARMAQASPAGRYLTFLSQAPLTGYDNEGPCESDHANHYVAGSCPEAFLYDSATGELRCPSCNPSGTSPLGHSALRLIREVAITPSPLPQPRYLLDSGRLYFDSRDSLSLADSNDGVEDVYQYEPEGVGSCKREGGCISLISPGAGSSDSNLLAVDETGKNVFFTTRDQLALKDKDELVDLYVAREGGGIPAETETLPGECQGEACQPQPSVPEDPTPASASFQGSGNVVEGAKPRPRCPKGKARRKGRCVAKKHPKRAKRHQRRAAGQKHGGAK